MVMDTLILGGDARMSALAALLRKTGEDAQFIDDAGVARRLLPEAHRVVTNNPPRLPLTLEAVRNLTAPGTELILCGPQPTDDPAALDLWKDETLLLENARFTAEGAVSAAMRASQRSLKDLPCAVIGWGRIGSALTELLVALCADVTVISRTPAHRNRAIERGAKAIPMEQLPLILKDARLIFSTPPAMVLDAERLERVNRDALIIDLASPPYGVDLAAAWKLGLRAWREPGLPGRYCPESAAEALLDAMKRGRETHD